MLAVPIFLALIEWVFNVPQQERQKKCTKHLLKQAFKQILELLRAWNRKSTASGQQQPERGRDSWYVETTGEGASVLTASTGCYRWWCRGEFTGALWGTCLTIQVAQKYFEKNDKWQKISDLMFQECENFKIEGDTIKAFLMCIGHSTKKWCPLKWEK